MSAHLPSPLCWNEQRHWPFNVVINDATFHLLRDHINMITDLGKDWASGPPSDFHCWIPMIYSVALDIRNYSLILYCNDHNIIDRPQVKEENSERILKCF